jgi:hypothetical protein
MGHGSIGLDANGQNTPERRTGIGFVVDIAGLKADVAAAIQLDRIVQRIAGGAAPRSLPR